MHSPEWPQFWRSHCCPCAFWNTAPSRDVPPLPPYLPQSRVSHSLKDLRLSPLKLTWKQTDGSNVTAHNPGSKPHHKASGNLTYSKQSLADQCYLAQSQSSHSQVPALTSRLLPWSQKDRFQVHDRMPFSTSWLDKLPRYKSSPWKTPASDPDLPATW